MVGREPELQRVGGQGDALQEDLVVQQSLAAPAVVWSCSLERGHGGLPQDSRRRFVERDEQHVPRRIGAHPGLRFLVGHRRGACEGVAVHAAADRGQGNSVHAVLLREGEAAAIAGSEEALLAGGAAPPDGTDRVKHEPSRQREGRGRARGAGRAAHSRVKLGDASAGREQPRPRGAVNSPIDAPSAQHALVGRVDDCVHLELRDVPDDDLDSIHGHSVPQSTRRENRSLGLRAGRRRNSRLPPDLGLHCSR